MKKSNIGTWFVAVSLGVGLAVGLVAQAWAEYPPEDGNVVLAADSTTADLGEEVAVTATISDQNGDPAANVDCTFSISEQPGDDASVDAGPFISDADGNVSTTLDTGSTEGTIVVDVDCGDLSAQVSVVAGTAAAPPASLPSTGIGAGAEAGSTVWALWALIAMGVTVGFSGLALGLRRSKA